MYIKHDGNVGIGTDAPDHRLDLGSGSVGNVNDIFFDGGPDANSHLYSPNEENWNLTLIDRTNSNAVVWQCADGGNMGIGGAPDANKLKVHGGLYVTNYLCMFYD